MKRIFLLALGAATLLILLTIISIGLNPAGFVNCFRDKSNDAALHLKTLSTPGQASTPGTPASKGKALELAAAHKFGHQLAAYIEKGYSVSDQNLYAMCSWQGQQEGYDGEELERFINIAKRDAAKLSQ